MIELSTGILATANLRFSRIVCHSNKYVGTFAALGQRSRFDVHAKVLLVFTFGRDVQRSSIFGDSGVQRGSLILLNSASSGATSSRATMPASSGDGGG